MLIRLLKVRLGRIIGLLEDGIRDYVSYVIIRLFKVGMVQEESPAEKAGLRTRDFIWKVNGVEVFNKTHAECVKMIKAGGKSVMMMMLMIINH